MEEVTTIETVIRDLENGSRELTLPPGTLRRIARLHARVEGANAAAQAAIAACQQAQASLQTALNEACEEEGLNLPPDANLPVDMDWRRGVLTVRG